MRMKIISGVFYSVVSCALCVAVWADEPELQDMSDPLAVYTQAGAGYTNQGLNIKLGKSYDSGVENQMAMNIIEIKGIYGEALGWDSGNNPRDNSVDSFRFRNFKVNTTNGRGAQVDVSYSLKESALAERSGTASYSLMQALPKLGRFQFYPLLGGGVNFGLNIVEDDGRIDSGYSVNGAFGLVGMYSKFDVTDKIWLNYNPFWFTTLSGATNYQENAYGPDQSDLLTHEFAASYQFTPRFNLRYFANWTELNDFSDGNHRLEFNYQI
ncbi:hypothetical protein [Agaribacterium sp. ZY112]|uniref:hypothetical protein n=1 Tax=Agaribacterium sp. ZY112 TaxID=3233574 RepID=UPI003523991D